MIPFWRENEKLNFNMDFQEIKFITFENTYEEIASYPENTLPILVPYIPNDIAISLPFYLTVAGHFRVGEKHFTQREGRLGYQCILTVDGNAIIELENGESFDCTKGTLFVLDCMPRHCYHPGNMGFWEYKHFHFCAPAGQALPAQTLGLTDSNPHIEELFDKIFQSVDQNHPTAPYVISNAISGILTEIVYTRLHQSAKQPHQDQLETAATYLRTNFNFKINIDNHAKSLFLSRYYFIRLFKDYFGMSPYSYLTAYRINQAKERLLINLTVDEVAQSCGFGNANNLNRIFKKNVGLTPTEFKKKFSHTNHD
mgnify:CR=1 FL=1